MGTTQPARYAAQLHTHESHGSPAPHPGLRGRTPACVPPGPGRKTPAGSRLCVHARKRGTWLALQISTAFVLHRIHTRMEAAQQRFTWNSISFTSASWHQRAVEVGVSRQCTPAGGRHSFQSLCTCAYAPRLGSGQAGRCTDSQCTLWNSGRSSRLYTSQPANDGAQNERCMGVVPQRGQRRQARQQRRQASSRVRQARSEPAESEPVRMMATAPAPLPRSSPRTCTGEGGTYALVALVQEYLMPSLRHAPLGLPSRVNAQPGSHQTALLLSNRLQAAPALRWQQPHRIAIIHPRTMPAKLTRPCRGSTPGSDLRSTASWTAVVGCRQSQSSAAQAGRQQRSPAASSGSQSGRWLYRCMHGM